MTETPSSSELRSILAAFKEVPGFEDIELDKPESPRADGDTPLHVVAINGWVDVLRKLLPFVTEINVPGDIGYTPLHCAVIFGNLEVAALLLENGADIKRPNEYGDTPLGSMESEPKFAKLAEQYAV